MRGVDYANKMVCDDRTLREVANEFLALKKAQKVRERILCDYKKYIDKFLEQSADSLDVDILKVEIIEYFADIPTSSPATLIRQNKALSPRTIGSLIFAIKLLPLQIPQDECMIHRPAAFAQVQHSSQCAGNVILCHLNGGCKVIP